MFIMFKVFSIQGKEVKSYAKVANVVDEQILVREFWKGGTNLPSLPNLQVVSMDIKEHVSFIFWINSWQDSACMPASGVFKLFQDSLDLD